MTIFRVSLDDAAKVIRALQQEEPEVKKHYEKHKGDVDKLSKEWEDFVKAASKFDSEAKKILAESRKGYTLSDKKLKELGKDKRGNKEKIEHMTKVRKYFYETGMSAKELLKISKQVS
ncbi:MAG: hypothetical protein AAGA87_03135 [Pseudomonadota bacterium]